MPKSRGFTLPGTLRRSPAKAQRTFLKVKRNAEARYGPGERAGRTAYAALKYRFEKVGNRWVAKGRPGPSDSRSRRSSEDKRAGLGETFGGVDTEGHTRRELLERAASLNIRGRSRMTKAELARAIRVAQD